MLTPYTFIGKFTIIDRNKLENIIDTKFLLNSKWEFVFDGIRFSARLDSWNVGIYFGNSVDEIIHKIEEYYSIVGV